MTLEDICLSNFGGPVNNNLNHQSLDNLDDSGADTEISLT